MTDAAAMTAIAGARRHALGDRPARAAPTRAHGDGMTAYRHLRRLGTGIQRRLIDHPAGCRPFGRHPPHPKGQTTMTDTRCPAAQPDNSTPCDGPIAVTVLDAQNARADGCERHAARLLASLEGGRVYALPDAPEGAAIRVNKAAGRLRPFPWATDAPRPDQLSREENRSHGER